MADTQTIIAIAASAVAVIAAAITIIGQGGILGILRSWRQEGRDELKVIWETFEKQIELAKKRGDEDEENRISVEYGQQLEAWRAQQGLEKLAPREITPLNAESSLAPDEVEQLKKLLADSQALSPAVLSAEDYFLRGNSYYESGQFTEALQAYDQALALSPDDPATLVNRGVALGQLGRYNEELESYDQSLGLRPDHAGTLSNRSVALYRLDRFEEALQALDEALAIRPDDPDTLHNRGSALSRLGRFEEALQAYDEALARRPDDPDTHSNRGIALGLLGRYDDAQKAHGQAIALGLHGPYTFYNRSSTYSVWGKPDEAVDDLRRAIEGDAKYRQMAREDSDFDNIRDDPRFQELVGEPEPPDEEESEPGSDE